MFRALKSLGSLSVAPFGRSPLESFLTAMYTAMYPATYFAVYLAMYLAMYWETEMETESARAINALSTKRRQFWYNDAQKRWSGRLALARRSFQKQTKPTTADEAYSGRPAPLEYAIRQ